MFNSVNLKPHLAIFVLTKAKIFMVVNLRFLLPISFNQKICFFFKMIGFKLNTLLHWSSYFFDISLMLGFISSSSYSTVKMWFLYERQLNDSFFIHNNRWTLLRIFLVENQEDKMFDAIFWCWMACMYPYLVWNIGPLSLTLHCHRVSLYIIQSLLCAFDSSAHPCASLQLRCVWSAHPRLSVTITAPVVS